MKNATGLIHIYCGDGKGKTTAAIGLAVRAAGAGLKVLVLQFLKSGLSAELNELQMLDNITVMKCHEVNKFTFAMDSNEKHTCREKQTETFEAACRMVRNGDFDVLILDEAIGALCTDTLCCEVLMNFLRNKPTALEVIITGRNPSQELLDLADYVTEMKKIKHPFDKGIQARSGIEK